MDVQIHELRPTAVLLEINNKTYKLRQFNLDDEVWAVSNYGDTNKMLQVLTNPTESTGLQIFYFIWRQLPEPNEWPVYKLFEDFILSQGPAFIVKQSGKFLDAVYKVLENSAPIVKNIERAKEISRQAKAKGLNANVCYARYYDKLARTYGYTLEQFYSLTLRQVHLLLKSCGDGDYSELEIQAALAGRKLPPRVQIDENVTPEQEKDQEAEAKEAHKQLMKKFLENKVKK